MDRTHDEKDDKSTAAMAAQMGQLAHQFANDLVQMYTESSQAESALAQENAGLIEQVHALHSGAMRACTMLARVAGCPAQVEARQLDGLLPKVGHLCGAAMAAEMCDLVAIAPRCWALMFGLYEPGRELPDPDGEPSV